MKQLPKKTRPVESVSSKKRSKRKLQKTTARDFHLTSWIERVTDGLISLMHDGAIEMINDPARAVFGISKDEVDGKIFWDLVPMIVNTPFFAACQRALLDQREKYVEGSYPTNSNPVGFSIYPSASGLTILVRDLRKHFSYPDNLVKRAVYFQALANNLGDLMIYQMIREFDGTRRFTFVSDNVEKLTGRKPSEIIDDPKILSNLIVEEDRPQFYTALESSYRDMSILDIELRFKSVSGAIRWVRIWSTPHMLADGRIMKDGFYTDITERKQAEQELRNTELRYRSLIDQASDAIMISDNHGYFSDVNVAMTNWFGYSREELLQMNINSLIDPEQLKTDPVDFEPITQGHSVLRERRMISKSGQIIEVEANVKMLPDGRVLAIARDITERKKAADLLRKEKELSESIINSLPGIFYLRSFPGRLLKWNLQMEKITGYSALELHQMPELGLVDPRDRPHTRQKIEEILSVGKADLEIRLLTKDSRSIPYHIIGTMVQYEAQSCIVGVGIDMSEGKKTQEELKRINEQLRQLSAHLQFIREEERTSVAREIHDELGQQLTGLKMDISWLRKKLKNVDDLLYDKLSSMNDLVDQTVGSVRRISSKLRPSVLDDLGLVDALQWQSVEFENRYGIQIEFLANVSELSFPPDLSTGLFRIYQESLTNVARHSGAKKVFTTLELTGASLVLTVTDDGQGFDNAAPPERKTFGLLGIQERAGMLGGKFEFSSEPQKGTIVKVSVPFQTA